jgi:hypothetical protein
MQFRHYRGKVPPSFAHPAEEELAELLDEQGIAWEYEPQTFPLERGPDGTVHQAITPDFYLPRGDGANSSRRVLLRSYPARSGSSGRPLVEKRQVRQVAPLRA